MQLFSKLRVLAYSRRSNPTKFTCFATCRTFQTCKKYNFSRSTPPAWQHLKNGKSWFSITDVARRATLKKLEVAVLLHSTWQRPKKGCNREYAQAGPRQRGARFLKKYDFPFLDCCHAGGVDHRKSRFRIFKVLPCGRRRSWQIAFLTMLECPAGSKPPEFGWIWASRVSHPPEAA